MKLRVAILVYDRINNLNHWLDCWDKCSKGNGRLIVVHNTDNFGDRTYVDLCHSHGVDIIERPNIGMDIGAFQDLCRDTLWGFPEWDRVLWMTDDVFPMTFDFVEQFSSRMTDGIGVVAMQLSNFHRPHIRTSAFMIDKKVAVRLKFSANPVKTKMDGYNFEHRHATLTFYDQIKRMGLKVVQAAPDRTAPLWDSGYPRRIKRIEEHKNIFGDYKNIELPKHNPEHSVTFVSPIFKGYPQIISSLLQQTNPHWFLWLIHDGPGNVTDVPEDSRIRVIYTEQRAGNWGHVNRANYLQLVETEFVVISNADNYHVPTYIEYMLKGFTDDSIVGVYCSEMVHNYVFWKSQKCRLERGYIDCAGMMLRTKLAKFIGWRNTTEHSADWLFFQDLINHYGIDKFVKIEGCLLIHN